MKNAPNDILSMLLSLCNIQSVNGDVDGENELPIFLKGMLHHWSYFKKNQSNIWLEKLEYDPLKRHNFCAIIRAEPATKRTLILISHHDTVPADEDAFLPMEYTKNVGSLNINEDARRDLESGDWLFGRGVSDMKGGMAVQLGLFAELSEIPDRLTANILLMTLADEENNGFGVHQAVRMLVRLQEQEGLEYIACIDSEPTITSSCNASGRIYTGTIGNATLLAICAGIESHVGEYFNGVNSSIIAAKMIENIESDPETSDSWMGTHYSPAACLKVENLYEGYSVTLPERTALLFNVLPVEKTPRQLLAYLDKMAETSMEEAYGILYNRREQLRNNGYSDLPKNEYKPRVISYSELMEIFCRKNPDLDPVKVQEIFLQSLPNDLDTQERGIFLADHLLSHSGLQGPFVLTALISPYCQPRVNKRKTEGEKQVLKSAEKTIILAKERHGITLMREEIYEGISDLSELGYQGEAEDIMALKNSLVGWGIDLHHPFEDMQKLDIPVLNIGPIGKDAHSISERVNLPFLLNVLPDLLKSLVLDLIK